ncbi:hypothetical protein A3709_02125 [Halioglobus sp. HI00S01]|uniref:hypothetical protein n=1 Tax=Halioglobus sp. HI00S01 TaxID=1822214 RepID=UPI0007C269D3|nr:hypothetical protein [Halioglobus sp. HI00S01]KZX58282.1 hypothetical protein A3709_02125 [Halioglobus sp. HI00S01]
MIGILESKWINGWRLFALIAFPLTAVVILELTQTDVSGGAGVSEMIGFSVRLAVPFIFLAMAASAFQVLFPGPFGRWWLRNRRYIGLCFAVGMAWQGLFIFILSTVFRDYYLSEVYYFRDELEGTFGYLFLAGMIATSFQITRKRLSRGQWKFIHTGGTYVLWGYAFSVYWWNMYYYPDPQTLDAVYYWAGFSAFALRIAAWGKIRLKTSDAASSALARTAGWLLILGGLVMAATGRAWQDAVTTAFTTPAWSAQLELWLPFWPLEPYLSLLLMGLGTAILTHKAAQPRTAAAAT